MSEYQELQVNETEMDILKNVTVDLICKIESQGEALGASAFGGFLNRRVGDCTYFYPLYWLENGSLIAEVDQEEVFFLTTLVQSGNCADLIVFDPHGAPVHLGQHFSLIEENGDTQLVITPTEYLLKKDNGEEVFSALILNAQHHLFQDCKRTLYPWNSSGMVSAISKIYNKYGSMADVKSFFGDVAQDESLSYLVYLLINLNQKLYCPEPAQNV